MGKAAAISTVIRGGNALIVSRSQSKLDNAAKEINFKAQQYWDDEGSSNDTVGGTNSVVSTSGARIGIVYTAVLDVTDEDAVQQFAREQISFQQEQSRTWDALVFSAAGKAPHGPITELPTSQTQELFQTKFWGAYHCAKHISPHLNPGGCIVFVGGVLNRRPGINCSPLASTNGALEGLTRALALELGPSLRVNCLSPGFCDTERFDHMDEERKRGMLENTADSLPLKRVGQPEDMGEAIYYLLSAKFVTGVVLDCDGGHHIRQYANSASDPMRSKD